MGVASELVRYDKQYDNIFKNLLGRTVVMEDLDSGIALARKFRNGFRIVTLDGQVINRGGSMTGGSVNRSAACCPAPTSWNGCPASRAPCTTS